MQNSQQQDVLTGTFQHVVYAPHGTIEGIMLRSADSLDQLVFDEAGEASLWQAVRKGTKIEAEGEFIGWSSHKDDAHRVFALTRVLKVDGRKPTAAKPVKRAPAYSGKVVRLNYARHGEPNGVVLDTGDFIHVKPEGFKKLKLQVGDTVAVDGDSHALDAERGYAVEALRVNGKIVR